MKGCRSVVRALCLLIALLYGLGADPSLQLLPAPENVTIYSYNLQQDLRWEPVKESDPIHPVTYTVQYELTSEKNSYHNLCLNIIETHCNISKFTEIKIYFKIVLRVRAEQGNLTSKWTLTPTFQATRNTTIGPVKSLSLSAYPEEHYSLYVRFQNPLLVENKWKMLYQLNYWKKITGVKTTVNITQTSERLKDLDPWTEYCVDVTVFADRKVGETSEAICAMPTASALSTGNLIALLLALGFLVIAAFLCAYMMFRYRTIVKSLFHVPFHLPSHIQEYIQEHSQSHVEYSTSRSRLDLYDSVSIVDIELVQDPNESVPEDSSQSEIT
ncbi:interferon gamma receptor 2-like [Pelobates fuscus]|uniref:interferon gamma receptor 2-like n=1 Tax=Pelobates fuscus TaxID=191477 RepID=UPI002FE46579